MKSTIQLMATLLLANILFAQTTSINAVIGDISFFQRFQQSPDKNADEWLRIQTHLRYVEFLLRQKTVSHLNGKQKHNRAKLLDLLHQYVTNGVFPKNYDYAGRRPCFIDKDGNICAVGYLIEHTAGRKSAEQINALHKYEYLLDMNEDVINDWAKEYGLTMEECAMIQPTYGQIPTDETFHVPLKSGYGIASGFLGGVNLGVSLWNVSHRNFAGSEALPYFGLLSGTSQVIVGLTNIRKDDKEYQMNGPSRTISYQSQNSLSYINIAAGTTTVLTSALNLLMHKRTRRQRNAFNLYSYADINSKIIAGVAFTRNF